MRPLALFLLPLFAMAPQDTRQPLPSPEEIAKLPPDGGAEFNRLIFEPSPYLLQHARNPVDWFPWGDEAFSRARKEEKPVFLSVGYSTCHWCHVMEHESFEDEEVAQLLNQHFVCIKVDREERPDLDALYMGVTQAMTGSGGWPMTVFLTPEKKPFFAGTYFPKQGGLGRPGMLDLLPKIAELWRDQREELLKQADLVLEHVERAGVREGGTELDASVFARAFTELERSFDPVHGGFGERPKFPIPHQLLFLLQHHERTGSARALEIALATLRAWRAGGIFDQLGYGLHRYSTDPRWLVPHFEKMLYDQALAAMAFTAAWQVSGAADMRAAADQILVYVLRDLTAPEGAFYSAEDADSEGEEGKFYLWTRAEILSILGDEEGELFARAFGVVDDGNFHDEATGEKSGRNVLHLPKPLDELAVELEREPLELVTRLDRAREKLLEARGRRIRPLRDDKVLTDWNGLMIAAFARAAAAFEEPKYAAAAARAADFVLANLKNKDGRLLKRWRNGAAGLSGTLEDYAYLAWGLIELYEATFEVRYLAEALELAESMLEHFLDREAGGFFLTADDELDLPLRTKEVYDGALPSGTSVAILALLRLARFTGRSSLEEAADAALRAHSIEVSRSPSVHALFLLALDFALGPSFELVVAGDPASEKTRAILRELRRPLVPHKVLLLRPPGDEPAIAKLAPFTLEQKPSDEPLIYLCRDFACQAPTSDVGEVLEALGHAR